MIANITTKIGQLLSTIQGWLCVCALSISTYFAGHELAINGVVIATVLDLIWGIAAAVARKQFALSELARDTISKVAIYGTALIIFVSIDRMSEDYNISVPIISSLIMLIEAWSFAANALIVFPDFPLLKLLQKVLSGEIANKLHIEPSEVELYMNGRRNARKKNNNGK